MLNVGLLSLKISWTPIILVYYSIYKVKHIILLVLQGFDVAEGGGILLISSVIKEELGIPCFALMGANLANEVAAENYCEATIGKRFLFFYYQHHLYSRIFLPILNWATELMNGEN